MSDLRLGDILDDYCNKCRRLTNHAIVSIVNGEVAKVRCRSCYYDHDYQHETAPPSKKDLKKAELFNAVLAQVDPSGADGAVPAPEPEPEGTAARKLEQPALVEETAQAAPAVKKARGRTKKA